MEFDRTKAKLYKSTQINYPDVFAYQLKEDTQVTWRINGGGKRKLSATAGEWFFENTMTQATGTMADEAFRLRYEV